VPVPNGIHSLRVTGHRCILFLERNVKNKKSLSILAAIKAIKVPRKLTRDEYDGLDYEKRLEYVRARVAGRSDFSAFGNAELLRYFECSQEEFAHPGLEAWPGSRPQC
jgi:hypothetical protein